MYSITKIEYYTIVFTMTHSYEISNEINETEKILFSLIAFVPGCILFAIAFYMVHMHEKKKRLESL